MAEDVNKCNLNNLDNFYGKCFVQSDKKIIYCRFLQEFPSLDTKCVGNGCWYCCTLCDVCMQPCRVGLNKATEGILQKFCSNRCLAVINEENLDATFPISVDIPDQDYGTLKHLACDQDISLQFHAKKVVCTHLARNTLVYVSLLVEKYEKSIELFVLQQLRTTDHLAVLGFSLSEDLSILNPLVCYKNKDAQSTLTKVKKDSYTKLIIKEATEQKFGFSTLKQFMEHHAVLK